MRPPVTLEGFKRALKALDTRLEDNLRRLVLRLEKPI